MHRGGCERLVMSAYLNTSPLFPRAGIIDVCEAVTFIKSEVSNFGYAVGYGNAR